MTADPCQLCVWRSPTWLGKAPRNVTGRCRRGVKPALSGWTIICGACPRSLATWWRDTANDYRDPNVYRREKGAWLRSVRASLNIGRPVVLQRGATLTRVDRGYVVRERRPWGGHETTHVALEQALLYAHRASLL